MWKWRHFESLDSLLQFVNEHDLSAESFKIVNSPAPRRAGPYGAPMYLIYREPISETDDPSLVAAATEELTDEKESALNAAERILQDATDRPEEDRA